MEVTDGDTIRVRIDGQVYPLRYIGIDAPERGDDLARQATRANTRLVDGARVVLEKDVSDTDRYDRLLRHVWLKDGSGWLLVSAELVRRGLAYAKSYPPDTAHDDLLAAAESEAQDAAVGLWAAGAEPQPLFGPPSKTPRPLANPHGCDPSYPGVCIAASPPDLDCGNISFRRFTVLPPDPHRFDGDFDGIGCES